MGAPGNKSNEWKSVLATLSIIFTPNTRQVLPKLQSIIEFLSLNLSDLCNKISLRNIIDNSAAKNGKKNADCIRKRKMNLLCLCYDA